MSEIKKKYQLSTEQLETLMLISKILKERQIPIFTIKDLLQHYPYLNYLAMYMRLKRLHEKGLVEPVVRGGFTLTEKGRAIVQELTEYLSKVQVQ